MIPVLVRRTLFERRRMIASLTVAALAMAAMTASLYSSIGADYDELMENLPAAMASMLGDADLGTPEGWLQVELFSIVAPGLAIGAGISLGAGSIAGAEQAKRLTLITTCPLRRSIIVRAAVVSVVFAITAVVSGLFAGITIGSAVGGLDTATVRVLAACASLGLLAIAHGTIALAAGAITGRRGSAVAIATGIAVASYAVDAFFPLSNTLEPFSRLTLWYPYGANQPLLNGLAWSHVAILIVITGMAGVAATLGFERRDLHA